MEALRKYPWRMTAMVLACWAAPVLAQPAVPTGSEAAPAPVITERDLETARERYRMPSDEELARVPVPATPRLDALPEPERHQEVDLEALASGFAAGAQGTGGALIAGPTLLVFVSLGMPPASLARLVEQAAQTGAVLTLRGLKDGSLKHTMVAVQQLIGTRRVAVHIDPRAFQRYAVRAVPTFVLVPAGKPAAECAARSCAGAAHVSVAGDVTIDYALEHLAANAPAFAREARFYLQRMGKQ